MKRGNLSMQEKNYSTNEKELLQEIKAMLNDYFVCSLSEDNKDIIMSLENGQKFKLHISKIDL